MENNATIIESHTGIIKESTLEGFKKLKNTLQKLMIWTLVGGAICGALFILIGGFEGSDVIGKFMGTLFILGGAALVSLINFNKIETKISSVQAFAILGVITNVLWVILWILALWGVFDIWARGECVTYYYSTKPYCPIIGYSPLGLLTMVVSYLSSLGFFGAITLGIYEGNKKATIRPLKLTAITCLVYVEFHSIFRLFTQFTSSSSSSYSSSTSITERFDILAGFAGFVWFVTVIVAAIIAKHEKNAVEKAEKKQRDEEQQKILIQAAANVATKSETTTPAPKTDEELRAEIEEKVRREMIEKEVRAKLEKEMAEKSANE